MAAMAGRSWGGQSHEATGKFSGWTKGRGSDGSELLFDEFEGMCKVILLDKDHGLP